MPKMQKRAKRSLRHGRVRARISGEEKRPRLSVFRSDKHIYAQIINDVKGMTLASASDSDIASGTKMEKASEVGKRIAALALERKVSSVRFDRGGYKYHGRVKALAESARAAGLKF